ncbi:hypothetical protein G4228_002935 [Cervus hanglu yarkandensis]|nr:hypothetical protein G4228_002935 [Cervus hanglu yarkandensis]
MADLEEGFTLTAVPLGSGPDGPLGVEQSDKTDQFLVTDSGRTVILYKVSDQKPLGSWSVKQGQIITCPAVCNFQTGEYIVVHDNKVLRIWNNEDVNLDKVFKATLSAEVYRIHSIQGTEPLVLFREGAVRGLEALLAEPQQKIETVISDEEVIKWTKFFMVFRHPVLIFITEKLWYYGENLFMLHGKFLTVIPYKCEVSSLAGALGKLKHSQDPGTHATPHFVNWETSQGCGLGSQNSEQSKRILRRRKVEVSVQPEVPASTQLLATIQKNSEKHIEVELRKFLATKRTPDFHTIIGDVVTGLLGRCKAEPSFYPRSCLMQLVQTHVLSYSLCPGLMEVALEKTDVQILQLCLQQLPDIPESVTCACLKVFLSIGDDTLQDTDINMESVSDYVDLVQDGEMEEQTAFLQNGFNPEEDNCENCAEKLREKPQATADESTSCPITPKRAALLNAILHSAYSETFLLPHLKDIPAQHSTIMDWICLLLDANFTVVVMIPEAKRLLLSLYKFVKSQISICSELNKIEVSFRELQKLNQEKNNRELYSIEVLELF